jgi:uncharacterized membrane protein
MVQPDDSDRDHLVEIVIGKLLRTCVIVTSTIVVIGAALYLAGAAHSSVSYRAFHGEPARFRSVAGILSDAVTGDGRGIIEAGLLLLVLTPVLRVAFSAVAFFRERDYLYVMLTLVVLALLSGSLLAG